MSFQNATAAPIKRSNVDHTTNLQILFLFCLLVLLALLSAIGNTIWTGGTEFLNLHFRSSFHTVFSCGHLNLVRDMIKIYKELIKLSLFSLFNLFSIFI